MINDEKPVILIVEDEIPLLEVYTHQFSEAGFIVLQAHNGQEGLDVGLKEKPDIILLDILMPVMDGFAMMQRLRESGIWGKAVPIILLTNLSVEKKKIKYIIKESQPAYYLVKVDWSLSAIIEKAKLVVAAHYASALNTP